MLRREVRPHEAENPVGVVRVGRPDFRAVDQPVVALVLALRLQRGEVGARARLGIALAPARPAGDDVRKEASLLFLAGVLQQHRPQHPHPERGKRRARIDPLEFLVEHDCFSVRQSAAAIGFRPCRRGPPLGGHAIKPHLGIGIHENLVAATPDDFFFDRRRPHRGGAIRLKPGAGFGAKCLGVGHACLP